MIMKNSGNSVSEISETRPPQWKDDWQSETPYIICVKYKKGYGLWSKCNDPFYTGPVMNMNYCPVCGRKLV